MRERQIEACIYEIQVTLACTLSKREIPPPCYCILNIISNVSLVYTPHLARLTPRASAVEP